MQVDVLDPFGGSGSTLIACEKAGRQARLIELDPKYCDVIVRRWQELSGGAATLDGDGRTYDDIAAEREAVAA
jgi:DNA modification methylase